MKIKQYLTISFGAIMVVAVIVCGIIFYSAIAVRWQNERVRLANSQLIHLKDIHSHLNRMLKEVTDYIVIGKDSEFQEFFIYRDNVLEALERFKGATKSEFEFVEMNEKGEESAEQEVAARLEADVKKTLGIVDEVVALPKTGDMDAAVYLLEQKLEPLYDDHLAKDIEAQVQDETNEIHAGGRELVSFTFKLQYITLALLVIMLVVIAVVAELVLQAIHRPIADLIPAIRAIGKGDFDVSITNESQNEIGALAVSLKKMATELRQTQNQLVQAAKLASIGQLAAGVAHELNTPLMVIRMNAQLLMRKVRRPSQSPADFEKAIATMERNTSRMKATIDHLRTFSRRSEGEQKPVDLNRVIKDALTMVSEQLKLHKIEIDTMLSPGLPKIQGNHNELEQVVVNFINNSKDALASVDSVPHKRIRITTGIGGTEANIDTGGDGKTARQIELSIRDNGGGIPEIDREKIFDPFYTTKPIGKGTGLGLSIAYGIVRHHEGEIRLVESGPEGTEFQIVFWQKGS